MEIILILDVILVIVLTLLILKNRRLKQIKSFVYRLFWVDFFHDEKNKKKTGHKLFKFYSKFCATLYIFLVLSFALISLTIDKNMIIGTLIVILVFPIFYRLIIGLQRLIHDYK